MMTLILAFRNLRRNLRRSIITLLAIMIGLTVMILSLTLRTGQYNQMINSGVSQLAGHVVVQQKGYQEDREVDQLLHNRDAIKEQLQGVSPDGVITTRLFLTGLLQASGVRL